ncbi:TrkA family potassium uptake protein [Candidatus Nezhaarchaeota archaeon WYZ-LMO8]|nr:MAG: TrkA family potassium uptake protein [Candidatus Nezhaarchaeota archaeon WYZ-LMO8]TDA35984.1 MAG: TrkA family potassium uptake protein [Candidatus Nezhaarchaeota archaeon WYZ-LMO7]
MFICILKTTFSSDTIWGNNSLRIIVVGGGKVGSLLSKKLIDAGHEVIIIEIDESKCRRLSEELDATVIKGDATNVEFLEKAGLEEADALAAVTGRDEANILVGLIAKEYGVPNIVIRVSDKKLARMAERLGIAKAVAPEEITAEHMASLLLRETLLSEFTKVTTPSGSFSLLEFTVTSNSLVVDRRVSEIPNSDDWLIVALIKDNSLKRPDPNLEIKEGDRVLVLARTEVVDDIKRIFTG